MKKTIQALVIAYNDYRSRKLSEHLPMALEQYHFNPNYALEIYYKLKLLQK